MTKQTSASERIEAARKALAMHDDMQPGLHSGIAVYLAEALRALITPPSVGEGDTVNELVNSFEWPYSELITIHSTELADLLEAARDSGIQSAHESWESADVPSQEFMLRHLGIEYAQFLAQGEPAGIEIFHQVIEQETI